jgi:hypothetical protein
MVTQLGKVDAQDWMYQERKDPQTMKAILRTPNLLSNRPKTGTCSTTNGQMIKQVLCNFNIKAIRSFSPADEQRLLNERGITTNKYQNLRHHSKAKKLELIAEQCGSFQAYLVSFNKSNNYHALANELADTFEGIGPTTAVLFLFSVGENIKPSVIY